MSMVPYYQDDLVTIYCGDNREVMAELEAESIHAVVTDPPYGLSDSSRDNLPDVFLPKLFDVFFPKFNNVIAKVLGSFDFDRPLDRVSLLNRMNRTIWKEPRVRMPEGAIDFDSDLVDWNEKVKHTKKPPVAVPDGELRDIVDAHRIKNGNSFFLKLRACVDSSLSDSATVGIPESGFGILSVFVVIPFDSEFASFLRSLSPSSTTGLTDIIGLLNDPRAFTESSATVMTSSGTELRTMCTFDLRHGTCEISPTSSARHADAVFEVVCPECVGALTGASSLSSMFKPVEFSFIGDSTDRAFSLYFHSFILPYVNREATGFMGRTWDHNVPSVESWELALRLLKPGGHLLSFASTRTQHRMAVNIEDAGFDIRDLIGWCFGGGFPKSMDVGKAIDKHHGADREVVGHRVHPTLKDVSKIDRQGRLPNHGANEFRDEWEITAPQTDDAKQWDGWGTALKPAYEPVTLARKPLIGTVAENVLAHGAGGLNIDACRVEPTGDSLNGGRVSTRTPGWDRPWKGDEAAVAACHERGEAAVAKAEQLGRWPANFIHDGSEEVLAIFPETVSGGGPKAGTARSKVNTYGEPTVSTGESRGINSGSAARFFYCAKASKADRGANNTHPTVKPIKLMEYLVRLVTPEDGIVLDPYMGSGSTLVAAKNQGFRAIGIEMSEEYCEIAVSRLKTRGLF